MVLLRGQVIHEVGPVRDAGVLEVSVSGEGACVDEVGSPEDGSPEPCDVVLFGGGRVELELFQEAALPVERLSNEMLQLCLEACLNAGQHGRAPGQEDRLGKRYSRVNGALKK